MAETESNGTCKTSPTKEEAPVVVKKVVAEPTSTVGDIPFISKHCELGENLGRGGTLLELLENPFSVMCFLIQTDYFLFEAGIRGKG